jgi:hypothetical protein
VAGEWWGYERVSEVWEAAVAEPAAAVVEDR